MDEKIGGGVAAGLTVIGAGSGMGKSTFALQMAQNVSQQGIPVLFFSMEMPELRIASKAISREYFLQTGKTLSSDDLLNEDKVEKFGKRDWSTLDKVRKSVDEACKNLYIIEGGDNMKSSEDIVSCVNAFVAECSQEPVVIVDYLQILTSAKENGFANARLVVDENVRNLKYLSQQIDTPVILISSLNREHYKNAISFEAFKESGTIEYSADEVWGIQFANKIQDDDDFKKEKAKMPREVELSIVKQRYHASESGVKFKFYCENDCFLENSEAKKIERKRKEKIQNEKFGLEEEVAEKVDRFGGAPRAN